MCEKHEKIRKMRKHVTYCYIHGKDCYMCEKSVTCVKKCYACYTCEKKGYIYEKHEKSCDMCEKAVTHRSDKKTGVT